VADRARILQNAFGVNASQDGRYAQWMEALTFLERVGAVDAEPGSRMLGIELVRSALLLGDNTKVTTDHWQTLILLLSEPGSELRLARNRAQLAARYLMRAGALSAHSELRLPDGTLTGRSWRDLPGGQVLYLSTVGMAGDSNGTWEFVRPSKPLWSVKKGRHPYVAAGAGDPAGRKVGVRLDDGSVRDTPQDVLAELLLLDRIYQTHPKDTGFVLLADRAGRGEVELPRYVADRLGMKGWATDGRVRFLAPKSGKPNGALIALESEGRFLWNGQWIPVKPGQVRRAAPGLEQNLNSYTVVENDGTLTGRAVFTKADRGNRGDGSAGCAASQPTGARTR
jgi:hypothetical protein